MLGERIKLYREKKNLTQKQLGDQVFVSQQCVQRWEKGKCNPDLPSLIKLSEVLGTEITELIYDDDRQYKIVTIRDLISFKLDYHGETNIYSDIENILVENPLITYQKRYKGTDFKEIAKKVTKMNPYPGDPYSESLVNTDLYWAIRFEIQYFRDMRSKTSIPYLHLGTFLFQHICLSEYSPVSKYSKPYLIFRKGGIIRLNPFNVVKKLDLKYVIEKVLRGKGPKTEAKHMQKIEEIEKVILPEKIGLESDKCQLAYDINFDLKHMPFFNSTANIKEVDVQDIRDAFIGNDIHYDEDVISKAACIHDNILDKGVDAEIKTRLFTPEDQKAV